MNAEKKDAKPVINVTPLIDVLLVLLIIFMTISPLKPTQFKTKVPQERSDDEAAINPHSIVITINRDLSLKLNQEENIGSVDETGKLSAELAKIFQQRKENRLYKTSLERLDLLEDEKIEKTVFIKAPRSVNYGEVVKVVDAAKGVGAEPIGLQVDDLIQ